MADELTISKAMEILAQDEVRKQKKRDALNKWRKEHKSQYNEYIKQWRKKRSDLVAEAKLIIEANKGK